MISLSLFWFAIPLAIFGAIALRMTVLVYRNFEPTPAPAGLPRMPRRVDPEPVPPTPTPGTGTDITARQEGYKTIPVATMAQEDHDEDERERGPMSVPPFKTAWALLAAVFFTTAFLTWSGRFVVLALLTILQSKGMVGSGDFGSIYLVVEALLLPVGFLLLARLLQELLPTTFLRACIVLVLSAVVFIVVVLAFFGLLGLFTTFVSWCFSWFKVDLSLLM